jgi:hypothetical protein
MFHGVVCVVVCVQTKLHGALLDLIEVLNSTFILLHMLAGSASVTVYRGALCQVVIVYCSCCCIQTFFILCVYYCKTNPV